MNIIKLMLKRNINPATGIFVLICVILFLVKAKYPEFAGLFYLSKFRFNFHPWTIVTYSLFHSNLEHLATNSFWILFAGQIIWWQHKKPGITTLIVLIAGILAGGLACIAFISGESIGSSAGASALFVFAITDTYSVIFGKEKKLKRIAYLIFMLLMLWEMTINMLPSEGVGYQAHIAGVVMAFLLLIFEALIT